jgi:hypothetical protein
MRSPEYLSIIMIAFVGHVLAASSIVSNSAPVSDLTIAFGFIGLSFSTTKTFGASVSQLPNARQRDGSTII